MDIHVRIDRLVLEGVTLPAGGGAAVGAALEAELGRLLAEGGLGEAWQAGDAMPTSLQVRCRWPAARRTSGQGSRARSTAGWGPRRSGRERALRRAGPRQGGDPGAARRAAARCACGQHTHGESECAECKKKGHLQRKLAVGATDDPLEREADRTADQVLAAPAHSR